MILAIIWNSFWSRARDNVAQLLAIRERRAPHADDYAGISVGRTVLPATAERSRHASKERGARNRSQNCVNHRTSDEDVRGTQQESPSNSASDAHYEIHHPIASFARHNPSGHIACSQTSYDP